ncbi:MAG: ABC transporter permease [Spirochaetia bacterium]|nr:ABC transporter permease [Spirochaetia bacterium]
MIETGLIATLTAFLSATLRMAMPLTLAGLGETFSEKSGILNIGLEAIMLSGAFFSFIIAFMTQSVLLGVCAGIAGGIAVSSIHAYLSIHCKVNQTIAGLALNFFIMGLTSFLFLIVFGKTTTLPECPVSPKIPIPVLSHIPLIGPVLFNQDLFVYFTFVAIFFAWFFINRTEWGINLHAVGEKPKAADSAGLNVFRIRYLSTIANGFFGGLAGSYLTLGLLGFFMENITSGKGYIALVVVILGRRNPPGILLAALVVGAAEALQFRMQTSGIPVPSQLFTMFPYVITVVVLFLAVGKSREPSALGIPYIRSKR